MNDIKTQCGESVIVPPDDLIDYERYGFGPDGDPINPTPTGTVRLAVLEMPHGTKIEFWGNPDEQEIGMIELGGSNDTHPTFHQQRDLSFLEMYTKLVPRDAPIPELFLIFEDPRTHDSLRKQYCFREYIDEPIKISDDDFDLVAPTIGLAGSDSNTGIWNCNQGNQAFSDFACQGSYPGNTWNWCDPQQHYTYIDRWTTCSHKRKKSLGIIAVCAALGYVHHYYKNCVTGKWHSAHKFGPIPGNHWAWTRFTGTTKRARWVRHGVQPTLNAYFRAFTAIYN